MILNLVRLVLLCFFQIVERITKCLGRIAEITFINLFALVKSPINRIAAYILFLFLVQCIGECIAIHVGFDITVVERNGPFDIGRRSGAIALINHVIAKLIC